MRKTLIPFIVAALIAAPAQSRDPAVDLGPGAFIGAQMKMSLGGRTPAKPHAAFAIAPTRSSAASDGMVRTRIGEGFALDFAPGAKPTVTLAGVRADSALGLQRRGEVNADKKLGISTGVWIGVGLSAALVIGGLIWYNAVTDCDDHDDEC